MGLDHNQHHQLPFQKNDWFYPRLVAMFGRKCTLVFAKLTAFKDDLKSSSMKEYIADIKRLDLQLTS